MRPKRYNLSDSMIPDGCRFIEVRAFRDCAELIRIRIPDSVESIDPTAFDGCARVYVIGRADSEAERFCAGKNHCIFIEQAEE